MSRAVIRLAISATIAGGGLLASAAPASACVGTQNTATVCTADREIYRDCVYTGGSGCKDVVVSGPTCIYGTIGPNTYYRTASC